MNAKELISIEQKEVLFYNDQITAVRTQDGTIYVPIKPICERLGIAWAAQRRRINRDLVLSQEVKGVTVTVTPGGSQKMLCLPLDFLSGFLFGINANRIKTELQGQIVRYQRECYRVLAEAFQEGQLTADPVFSELLQQDSEAVQAYKMAMAVVKLARNQILIEARLDTHDGRLVDHENRIETIEAQFGDESRTVSEDQASQISQAVKAIALVMSKRSGRNEYGGIYGEFYRKFSITSYKLLPANRFTEAMKFLTEWHQSLVDDASTPF